MASITKNFIYNSAITASGYIFPIIVYPYISRILGVSNIGICNFIDSIINYFIILSSMGIVTVGIREVAKHRNDSSNLNRIFSNLILLNGALTIFSLLLLLLLTHTLPQLYQHKELIYIGILKLFGNLFLLEWLYSGLEEFRYISIRTILVKVLYVILVFVLVREKDDYHIYFLLTCGTYIINATINLLYSRRFTRFTLKGYKPLFFIKPVIVLGAYSLLTSIYTTFNTVFLGFVSTTCEVGYYSTSMKLFSVIMGFYTAFTTVMLPRMSSLATSRDIESFHALSNRAIDALLMISAPIIILTIIYSDDIVYIIAGKGYEGAVTPMRIIMPLIFVIGYSQILVVQILTALKHDKAILTNSIIGAIIGIGLNIVLVPIYKATGSAIVWLMSELFVMSSAQHFVTKYTNIHFPLRLLVKNTLAFTPSILICGLIKHLLPNMFCVWQVATGASAVLLNIFVAQNYYLRNPLFISLQDRTLNWIKSRV